MTQTFVVLKLETFDIHVLDIFSNIPFGTIFYNYYFPVHPLDQVVYDKKSVSPMFCICTFQNCLGHPDVSIMLF